MAIKKSTIKQLNLLWERIQVERYSGSKANEAPTALVFQDRRVKITDIQDRWYEGGLDSSRPALYYFKVRTTDDEIYLLRYDPLFDKWFFRE
ncbi:MAG: cytoplasmic protein [candidate division KSB1 bacterium]|nr:cytoplasmic protein [candidate division KSB1 bacterium]